MVETLGIGYQDHWPFRQAETARGVKKSVLHDRLAAAGACFGESAGWERPNWYARPGQAPSYSYGWGRQNWFSNNAEEHAAVRERVGVFEQSSFAKLMVAGPRCGEASSIASRRPTSMSAIGRCVYTQFLNAGGGHRGGSHRHAARGGSILGGDRRVHPDARRGLDPELDLRGCVLHGVRCLRRLRHAERPRPCLARAAAGAVERRFLRRRLPVRDLPRDAHRIPDARSRCGLTYVGELGWELYIPTSFAQPVYDALIEAGKAHGLRHCGYHTLEFAAHREGVPRLAA